MYSRIGCGLESVARCFYTLLYLLPLFLTSYFTLLRCVHLCLVSSLLFSVSLSLPLPLKTLTASIYPNPSSTICEFPENSQPSTRISLYPSNPNVMLVIELCRLTEKHSLARDILFCFALFKYINILGTNLMQ